MATYALNPTSLLDSGSDLRAVTQSIQNAIDDLNAIVAQFINANAGGAADAYRQAQSTWNSGIAEMQSALAVGASRLDEIHDRYNLTDRTGAGLFAQ